MVQFSEGSSAFFAGKSLPNDGGVLQASILGAVAGAHYVRNVAPAYGIPVLVSTDRCAKNSLPWLDGMLVADEAFFNAYGEPLFSSHALDLSDGTIGAKYLQQVKPMKMIMELGFTCAPEDAPNICQQLSPISKMFTVTATEMQMERMGKFQKCVGEGNPLFFAFHGGLETKASKQDLLTAVSNGMVKMSVDTYLLEAEPYMAKRVMQSCADVRNVNENVQVAPDLCVEASWLSPEQKAALKKTADGMSAPGKGFLAADESAGPWLRAGHEGAAKIADTAENRAAYRAMCFTTPGLSQYISGVILHWETLFQSDAAGQKMVDLITKNGMIPGIKLDKGYDKSGLSSTAQGPLGHQETWDKGIDDLDKRCSEAYKQD